MMKMRGLFMNKVMMVLLAILLFFSSIPFDVIAEEHKGQEEKEIRIVYTTDDTDPIYLYENITDEEALLELDNETIVELVEESHELHEQEDSLHHPFVFVKVEQENDENELEMYEGYVEEQYIFTEEDLSTLKQTEEKETDEVEDEIVSSEEEPTIETEEEIINEEDETFIAKENEEIPPVSPKKRAVQKAAPKMIKGYAAKKKTIIYEAANNNAKKWMTKSIGQPITYSTYNDQWVQTKVKINNKEVVGYIKAKDVTIEQPIITGYALTNDTKLYKSKSKKSKVLKTYKKSAIITYTYSSKNWFKVTTKINGKNVTGYVHTKDVAMTAPKVTRHAIKNPTKVYDKRNRNGKVLKKFSKGAVVTVQNSTKNWYRVTVKIDGKNKAVGLYIAQESIKMH